MNLLLWIRTLVCILKILHNDSITKKNQTYIKQASEKLGAFFMPKMFKNPMNKTKTEKKLKK